MMFSSIKFTLYILTFLSIQKNSQNP
jgi:hypothetical protein